jgi:mRNA-degrading endonuclease toxin of MazEF toxin-antitoxin module
MNAWDVCYWDFEFGRRPVVIISHVARVARKDAVNVLKCSSHRATRTAGPTEVILEQADGLDWPTMCACDLIFAVPKAQLKDRKGNVTPIRRRALVNQIVLAMGWDQL